MKPERTQIVPDNFPTSAMPKSLHFTVDGVSMQGKRAAFFIDGVAVRPDQSQVSVDFGAFQADRFWPAFDQITEGLALIRHAKFVEAYEGVAAGWNEVRSAFSDVVKTEVRLRSI